MATFTKTFLGSNIGLPTYDRQRNGRIWVLKRDNPTDTWKVYYSDNEGTTWVLWGTPFPQPTGGRGPYIHRDKAGNIYYQSGSSAARTFYRMDAETKACTKVIDFYYPSAGQIEIFPWNFTEDNDGYIFVTQYYLSATGGHMMYRSTPEQRGTQFEALDILIRDFPESRHFHGTYANPFNGKLYVQIGDHQAKRFLVSSDKMETYKQIGGITGHTGLTFTSEAVYTSQDLPGSDNFLWRTTDDNEYKIVWTPPANLIKTPIYYCHAVGDNELWLTFVDDNQRTDLNTAVVRLTKNNGLDSPWQADIIDRYGGPDTDNSNWYAIASDGQGLIPTWSNHVFIEKVLWDTAKPLPEDRGIFKINRPVDSKIPSKQGSFFVNFNGSILKGRIFQNVNGQIKAMDAYTP